MSLTTCAVRARIYKQDGTPDEGARVVAVLNRFEVDEGYIGPTEVEATADADGVATLNLWPNALGSTESVYNIRIEGSERTLKVTATVPDTTTIDLEDIATLPAYPGKADGDIAAEEAGEQAAIATEQAAIATAQAATATTQAATATTQAGIATTQAGLAEDSADAAAASEAMALAARPTTSATPPADPLPNTEWIDEATGKHYTWLDDQGAWVETFQATVVDNPGLRTDIASTADSKGAGLVGFLASAEYAAGTVGAELQDASTALQLADYDALRAYAGNRKSVYITGYLVSAAPSGIAGMFVRDDADTTTADNGGTVIVATNGKRWRRTHDGVLNAHWFGAKGNGVADDRPPIQVAIDYANSMGGGSVFVPPGTYVLGAAPTQMVGRSYGLLMKANVDLFGQSSASTTLISADAVDIDMIITERPGFTIPNVSLRGITVDGNEANQVTEDKTNIWMQGVVGLKMHDVRSVNPGAFGIRINTCSRVDLSQIKCDHSNATNSDGIHFVDTSDVVGSNIDIYTEGDDAFIIEAINSDVANYAITSLNAVSTVARGIILMGDEAVQAAARKISNIKIDGAAVSDCADAGVVLGGTSFFNVSIDATVKNCASALYIVSGNPLFAGKVEGCAFRINGEDLTEQGVVVATTYGTVSKNKIDVSIRNPGDGYNGVDLRGTYWTGEITVDYNPNADKTVFASAIVIYDDYNSVKVSAFGSLKNLNFQGSAQNNHITIGTLSGGVTNDVGFAGGASPNFLTGGVVAGVIDLGGTAGNKFHNVKGATSYSKVTLNFATLGTGDAVVPHGLSGTPAFVSATLNSSTLAAHIQPTAIDATNVTFRGWNAGGTLLTTGTYSVFMDVRL